MKYQLDAFILDVRERTLSDEKTSENIRPKTLALLLYFVARPEQIISKQELLANVWDDVKVDDGVIFQSVREIRQLFSDTKVIQTHPRKGYEFTATVGIVNDNKSQLTTSHSLIDLSLIRHRLAKYFLAIAMLLLAVLMLITFSNDDEINSQYEQSIVVLPVKNHLPYGENEWIYLGAMEQLIAKLKGLPNSIFVYQGSHIPRLMHIAQLDREYASNEVNKIFNVSGATLLVETEIHGNAHDYKLLYKLHFANNIIQGVILESSINDALTRLSEKLAAYIKHPLQKNQRTPKKEFSDALFAEAMISYESDWQTSISFFESYLTLNPDSVIALIYLSKLYLWDDKLAQAEQLMAKAAILITDEPQEAAQVLLIKGRLAAKQKEWQRAMTLYQQAAQTIDKHFDWFLKASIAEEQGLAYLEQNLLTESSQAFKDAGTFYQIMQSPIGINSTQLHLANVLFKQGHIQQAKQTYLQAKKNIHRLKLEFLYSMLADYEVNFDQYLAENIE